MLAVSDNGLKVGNPTVAGATVEASVVENGKAKKVIVYKYKRKTGYHKKNGHRQQYTAVKMCIRDRCNVSGKAGRSVYQGNTGPCRA